VKAGEHAKQSSKERNGFGTIVSNVTPFYTGSGEQTTLSIPDSSPAIHWHDRAGVCAIRPELLTSASFEKHVL